MIFICYYSINLRKFFCSNCIFLHNLLSLIFNFFLGLLQLPLAEEEKCPHVPENAPYTPVQLSVPGNCFFKLPQDPLTLSNSLFGQITQPHPLIVYDLKNTIVRATQEIKFLYVFDILCLGQGSRNALCFGVVDVS